MSISIYRARPEDIQSVGKSATRLSAQRLINLNIGMLGLDYLCRASWRLSHNGEVFGTAGFVPVRDTYAICWAMFSIAVLDVSAIELTRKLHRGIGLKMARDGIARMESTVDAHDMTALRWAELLGFEVEGFMRKSSSENNDQWLIARIME